jgi:hypothetical protein
MPATSTGWQSSQRSDKPTPQSPKNWTTHETLGSTKQKISEKTQKNTVEKESKKNYSAQMHQILDHTPLHDINQPVNGT